MRARFPALFSLLFISALGCNDLVEEGPLEQSFVFGDQIFFMVDKTLTVISTDSPEQVLDQQGTSDWLWRLDKKGGTVYLANHDKGVQIVDASDPTNVSIVAQLPADSDYKTRFVKAAGNRLYSTEMKFGSGSLRNLRVFDIADPQQPVLLNTAPLASDGSASFGAILPIDPNHIAISFYVSGIRIYNVADPNMIQVTSTIPIAGFGSMVRKNDTIYVVTGLTFGTSKLSIWDLSDLSAPVLIGQEVIPRAAYDHAMNMSIAVRNGKTYLFWGATDGGASEDLLVVDVTNPSDPLLQAILPLVASDGAWVIPGDIDIRGDMAYVYGWKVPTFPPGYQYFLVRVDISVPSQPSLFSITAVPDIQPNP